MNDNKKYFDLLKSLIKEAIKNSQNAERASFQELLSFLGKIQDQLDSLPNLQAKFDELQSQVKQLGEPPLQYGVFLGTCPEYSDVPPEESDFNSHILFKRIENLINSGIINTSTPDEREQLKNLLKNLNEFQAQFSIQRDLIVGVHGQRYEVNLASKSIRIDELHEGQEVVLNKMMNVVRIREPHLRGDTAEVINVLSPSGSAKVLSIPVDGGMLKVQWPQGDKFEITCDEELLKTLHRGDIVRIDEKNQRAVAKIKPRLHVRSGGSEGIVVEISDKIFEEGIEIGDIVRVDTHLRFAFEKLPSYETGGLALEEVPDVTFEDIGGLDKQIEEMRDAIELPYIQRSLFEKYQLSRPKGILLHGPPGCGKTMIAKAVANSLAQGIRNHLKGLEQRIHLYMNLSEDPKNKQALEEYHALMAQTSRLPLTSEDVGKDIDGNNAMTRLSEDLRLNDVDMDDMKGGLQHIQAILRREDGIRSFFLNVKGPELLNKYVGETEHRIRKIFQEAKHRATFYTPVVIFFDEMEAMFRARGSGRSSDVETTIVPQFLSEMDGVEASENVIVIGASNRPDMIDPAIMRPGRLDVKIKIDRPDREAAMSILSLYLTPDLPLRTDEAKNMYDSGLCKLSFKPQTVRRTIYAMGNNLPEDELEKVISELPDRYDIRGWLRKAELSQNISSNPDIRKLIEDMAKKEDFAEKLIDDLMTLLYFPTSRLEVQTSADKRHTFKLSLFVSGAILSSVVSRAKKRAVKRQIISRQTTDEGISIEDLKISLKEEFDENAEQLATEQLVRELASYRPGHPGDIVQMVDVYIGEEEDDPWGVEKAKPYRT